MAPAVPLDVRKKVVLETWWSRDRATQYFEGKSAENRNRHGHEIGLLHDLCRLAGVALNGCSDEDVSVGCDFHLDFAHAAIAFISSLVSFGPVSGARRPMKSEIAR